MKKLIASMLCGVAILALAGCTTYEESYPAKSAYSDDQPVRGASYRDVCYVSDKRGRQWSASGGNACHHAVRKCRQWHEDRGIEGGRCWVNN